MFNQFPSLAEAFLNYFDIELVATQSERDRIGATALPRLL